MNRFNPWMPADLLRGPKPEYIPSHEREGFDEKKVIKLPTTGMQAGPVSKTFVISRDKPLYKRGK